MKLEILLLILSAISASQTSSISLTINGLAATLKNDHVELNFNQRASLLNATVDGVRLDDRNSNSFYLDWNNFGQRYFSPSSIHVVEQNGKRIHFYWLQENITNVFRVELHYIMEADLNGVYTYAKFTNDQTSNLTAAEIRLVYKFNSTIMNQLTNQHRFGTTPTVKELNQCTVVQDTTWLYPNGTYFSKYDFAGYIRQTNYQGVYGNGYGAFVISPSREYHGGGPLKQDLIVHQESLIANYLISTHFGTPLAVAAPGWTHIYGPWLVYFPTGDNDAIMSQVEKQTECEQALWPYNFVKEQEYPLKRGKVSGIVRGQKNATVVLWSSLDEAFEKQQLGYLYSAETDAKGHYEIVNVRPGDYRIAAYATAGLGSDSLPESHVTVRAGAREHVGFTLEEPKNIIWSLGEANRLSNEFKYSDQPRNYQWAQIVPVNNTFIIGKSDPKEDWYYAQAKSGGRWEIKYQDTPDGTNRTLRVALAACSRRPHLQVVVNKKRVGNVYHDNDQAVYRSAMNSGSYYSYVFNVGADQVVDGENTVDFWMTLGQIMYDAISLQKG